MEIANTPTTWKTQHAYFQRVDGRTRDQRWRFGTALFVLVDTFVQTSPFPLQIPHPYLQSHHQLDTDTFGRLQHKPHIKQNALYDRDCQQAYTTMYLSVSASTSDSYIYNHIVHCTMHAKLLQCAMYNLPNIVLWTTISNIIWCTTILCAVHSKTIPCIIQCTKKSCTIQSTILSCNIQ